MNQIFHHIFLLKIPLQIRIFEMLIEKIYSLEQTGSIKTEKLQFASI